MHPIRSALLRNTLIPLVAAILMLSGCGSRNYTSGYGNGFVTYTADAGDFSSYVVTLTSISLTRPATRMRSIIASQASPLGANGLP